MITRQLKAEIDKEQVLRQIDCYKESELYEEVVEEYEEILEEMYSLCEPVFLMEKGEIGPELAKEDLPEGTPVLFVISSIGKGISEYSTRAFAMGDYLKGMLSDAMADSALFSLEKEFESLLRETCAEYQMGIRRRLEAPQDIPMEAQKVVWEKTNAYDLCGIGISTGYMLDPVKSNAVIYVLTDDPEVFRHQHDCRACNRYDCKMRNIPDIPVKVIGDKNTFFINVKEKQSILDALMSAETSYTAICGGAGRCGKCKIRIVEGILSPTTFDESCFSKEELDRGMRLACMAYPLEPLIIELNFKGEAEFQVVTEYDAEKEIFTTDEQAEYGVAIDIGTTTLAMQLLNLKNGEAVRTYTAINHQRVFGADVIARIKAFAEGKKYLLQESIRKDIDMGIQTLLAESQIVFDRVKEVAIAGNTTMIHLLMGYDCESLGVYPFTPVNIGLIEDSYEAIIGSNLLAATVKILPGISAFVGGDIVSGLYACGIDQKEGYFLFIDLGTNGEIVLGNKKKLLTTSTAAGPAFEGGNIEWGVGSIAGAIAGVKITKNGVQVRTIGDKKPTGICGTGVIEATAELVRTELVDETGYLDEEYFDDGFPLAENADGEMIVFTQKDIREIQLAKSAVRAGIETLILRYGIEKRSIAKVYVAGGFGYKLDHQKAIEIGMIPEEFEGKIETLGNSSLGGAAKFLLSEDGKKRTSAISKLAEEINLSADKKFNELYMKYMFFEHE